MKKQKLTAKRERFCQKYIETGERLEAYRFSYNCKNMKPATISNNAYKLMQNNDIITRLNELGAIQAKKDEITKDDIRKMMLARYNVNLKDFYEIVAGEMKVSDSSKWTKAMWGQVKKIKQGRDGLELEFHCDKGQIEKELCKMYRFYEPADINVDLKTDNLTLADLFKPANNE